jgi:hypothetical protein
VDGLAVQGPLVDEAKVVVTPEKLLRPNPHFLGSLDTASFALLMPADVPSSLVAAAIAAESTNDCDSLLVMYIRPMSTAIPTIPSRKMIEIVSAIKTYPRDRVLPIPNCHAPAIT